MGGLAEAGSREVGRSQSRGNGSGSREMRGRSGR